MKNIVTIKFEIDAKLAKKLEDIRWHHAADNQKLLAELFAANRGTDAQKESDLALYSMIERFSMAEFAHVNAQKSSFRYFSKPRTLLSVCYDCKR